MSCNRVNERRYSDITCLWSDKGGLCLTVVIDLYSRRSIGWSMKKRTTRESVGDAMLMGINSRENVEGLIMHIDRGSQYCSVWFQRIPEDNGIRASIRKRGDWYDNAACESFFHTLKVETIQGERFVIREEIREAVIAHIETYYDRTCHNTGTGNRSPIAFGMTDNAQETVRACLGRSDHRVARQALGLRCDSAPEYVLHALRCWADERSMTLMSIKTGRPTLHVYIERFNRTAHHQWKDLYEFDRVEQARIPATDWLWSCNNGRPNSAGGGVLPAQPALVA